MYIQLKNRIKDFIVTGVEEELVVGKQSKFWGALKNCGTELWLDTGDMDEAEKNWSAEMTALTTNNTLINNEIQKGIYDEFILKAQQIVKDLPFEQQIIEIAFILNARHGLRLAKRFGGMVSVELHTDTAHDYDAIIDYGLRFFAICPEQFIVKIPYTATGLLGAKQLRRLGVRINFTLEFSARQNVMVATIAKPNYLNVFLGRLGAYVKDNNLGDGSGVGERSVLATQKWIKTLTKNNHTPTQLIAASLRSAQQLELLAGVDVYTMPTKVAEAGKGELDGVFSSQLDQVYPVNLYEHAKGAGIERLWEVCDTELKLAKDLDENPPVDGDELLRRAHDAGLGCMFPILSEEDISHIAQDGKIPLHKRWEERIKMGELAVDTLLNLAGLASFMKDQAELDARIANIIS